MVIAASTALAAAAAVEAATGAPLPDAAQPPAEASSTAPAPLFRTVEIASGRVQGMACGPVWEFKGIPYGAPTGGADRFMPPKPPASWSGVRECFAFGQVSPQVQPDFRQPYFEMVSWDRQGGGMGEDCLVLNVWTMSTEQSAKKAVLVSLHGGGFSSGSGSASWFDGKALSAYGDVVVVTVNHRLAALGYLNLEAVGAPQAFKYASVAGMLDLVAALRWVRDNIASFGGDPSRVMIFGDSAGGWKSTALMAMPGAKGLFHRAAAQSGSPSRLMTPDDGALYAAALVKRLGLSASSIAQIQGLPWQQILEAQATVGSAHFQPMIGTDALPNHPFDGRAPPMSADVPLIVSTTLEDSGAVLTNFDLDEHGLLALLEHRFPGRSAEVLRLYRRHDAHASPFLIQKQMLADTGFRRDAHAQAALKAAQARAPVWLYQWDWRTPAYDGKFGAVHGGDVPATFHWYRDPMIDGGAQGRLMVDRLSAAWVAFAKTGDPNNPLLPFWPAYDPTSRATMVFNNDTRAVNDPRGEIRAYWDEHPPEPA
jgi:para-nitrobenzyl esterase